VVLVVQGGIGYLQYFTGVPAALVALHIVGVVSVVWATLVFHLGLRVQTTAVPLVPAAPAAVIGPSR
jgi:cytochrome c oxidase assembly protein subunit 15